MNHRVGIVFIGSRGVPPRYGGAETFIYELANRLKERFSIFVTCESSRFGVDEYDELKRLHIYAPQPSIITIPIIYDIIATLYSIKKIRSHIFFYVAPDGAYAAIIAKLAGSRTIINTDGLEWKRLLIREKFAPLLQKPIYVLTALALLIAEFLACKVPDVTIADSLAIMNYLNERWKPRKILYVAYGIRALPSLDYETRMRILRTYDLTPLGYYLTIGRFVPENNLHTVIQAYKRVRTQSKLVLIGLLDPKDYYTRHLLKLRNGDSRILLLPPLYDFSELAALRSSCRAYIHPYSVGGTNPSLLEQLQFRRPIIAYDTSFHREILRDDGIYFKTVNELTEILHQMESNIIKDVAWKVEQLYSWHLISTKYEKIFLEVLQGKKPMLKRNR